MIRLVASAFRRKIIGAASLGLLALALWIRLGSIPSTLLENKRATSTIVVDRNGVPLYEARAEDGTRAISLSAETLPPVLVARRRPGRRPGLLEKPPQHRPVDVPEVVVRRQVALHGPRLPAGRMPTLQA